MIDHEITFSQKKAHMYRDIIVAFELSTRANTILTVKNNAKHQYALVAPFTPTLKKKWCHTNPLRFREISLYTNLLDIAAVHETILRDALIETKINCTSLLDSTNGFYSKASSNELRPIDFRSSFPPNDSSNGFHLIDYSNGSRRMVR
ncbi:unnamed protein product [Rotaria socialis]